MICVYSHIAKAQTIIIDSTFTSSAEIFPFNQNDTIYSLGVSGNVVLNSDTSLVRIIFIDGNYIEHLLYEAYPYISSSCNFNVANVSDETKYLNNIQPHSLYVYIFDGSFELTSLHYTSDPVDFADSLQLMHKQDIEAQKISNINDNIELHEMIWYADSTSISYLSYAEKKSLFGDNYNMLGMEYYAGGIYDPIPGVEENTDNSGIVPEFDWRNRHGANDPNKWEYYYDNDPTGSGWLTSMKDQRERDDCKGLCYIYAPLATAEGYSNLYFNQHLNFDLSEQHVLDCDGYDGAPPDCPTDCDCGLVLDAVAMLKKQVGVVDEECYPIPDPYVHPHACTENPFPGTVTNQVRIAAGTMLVEDSPNPSRTKKEALIEHGPLIIKIDNYGGGIHFMSLVGYGRLSIGDLLYTDYFNVPVIIDENSDYIGKNYWIYKNSWGTAYGDGGYMYHIEEYPIPHFIPKSCRYYIGSVLDLNNISLEIKCRDKDQDGYWNWGISATKPSSCPICPSCLDDRDSDDSEPRIGPFDENYFSKPVKPIMNVSIGPFQEIPNGGFYAFGGDIGDPQTFMITVRNEGNAQLNFEKEYLPLQAYTPITISGPDADHFTYNDNLDTSISMEKQDVFSISYDGECEDLPTCIVTIHLDEVDMENFTFAIVYADCNQTPSNITIGGVETWDGWRVITDNYKVEHGGKLTITGHVGFTDQVNFVVDKGGEIIIDGGSLINACSDTWKGIDVWGDANLSQYPASNQGCLRIINGGRIENAEAAVQLTKIENGKSVGTKNGGIISCDSALFRNNELDVAFYNYNNFHPGTGTKHPNRSYFYNTQFINNEICEKFKSVDLNNVDGILFKGCSFVNNVDKSLQNCQSIVKGVGIYSFNSGFFVDEYCLDHLVPCGNSRQCLFENLDYGIYALNAEFNEIISIDTATFYNTYRGVYMNLVDYPEIIRNQFIYDEDYQIETTYEETYGLDLEHCRSFVVEENVFSNSSTVANMVGLQVLNAGPYAHEIYNNTFIGLPTGITAAGENRNGVFEGLCIKCNDFISCIQDIFVTPVLDYNGYPIITQNTGIAVDQGVGYSGGLDNTLAAGNTFTTYNSTNPNYINNVGCNHIDYIYHGQTPGDEKIVPLPIEGDITPEPDPLAEYTKSGSCPSNLGSGVDILGEKSTLATEAVLVTAYEDTLAMNIDGGDTDGLNFDVYTSLPSEAIQLRQELLAESPYLSDTVIKTAINKENVLPNAMIRDVLVANPQSAKSSSVMQTLDQRFNPMPNYMMAEIMQGQNVYGAKELLERKLAKHKSKRSGSLSKLIHYYKSDTLNISASTDSIISLLQNENYPAARYQLGMLYMNRKDSANAFATLNNIPVEFDLTQQEENVHDLHSDLFDVLWGITSDTVVLDSMQIQTLYEISDNYRVLPGIYARNILINKGLFTYNEPVYLPDLLKSMPAWETYKEASGYNKMLHVFPNPAGNYFIAYYNLMKEMKQLTLIVTGTNGKIIHLLKLKGKENQVIISMNDYSAGIYMVNLYSESKLLESAKVIITK